MLHYTFPFSLFTLMSIRKCRFVMYGIGRALNESLGEQTNYESGFHPLTNGMQPTYPFAICIEP